MSNQRKSRSELQMNAVTLHGVLQGLELLLDQTTGPTQLDNAIHATCAQSIIMADALANELDLNKKGNSK